MGQEIKERDFSAADYEQFNRRLHDQILLQMIVCFMSHLKMW